MGLWAGWVGPIRGLKFPPSYRANRQLRRSLAGVLDQGTVPLAGPTGLSPQELQGMLDNMIKMTAENKITKDNAWDLTFIDHMHDLVK